jgi:glycosyltransferase involved in cell wall biosynthesis
MLRVVHICEQMVIGGISSFLKDLLFAIKDKNFKFKIIYFYGESNCSEEIKRLGIGVNGIGMKKSLRLDPAGLIKLFRQLRQFNPDLFHCHGSYPLLATLLLRPFFRRVPVIFTFHGTFRAGEQKSDFIFRKALRRCSDIVVVSKAGATALRNFYKCNASITVIYNGIDPYRMEVSKNFLKSRKKAFCGFTDEERIVLCIAQFNNNKDHKNLLLAFHKVKELFPQARLFLVGDGPLRKEVEDIINLLSLHDVVKLGGLRSDIAELMAMADLLVLSSKSEGLPITLLEASAAGLPFIATAVGGVPEIYEAGVPCSIVPQGDPEALFGAISTFLDDEDLRKNMGDEAKKAVRLHFKISSAAQKYAELYKDLVIRKS